MAQAPGGADPLPVRPIPARVGRYEILLPIASGGMATVYLARCHGARGFERQVALKLTHAHLSELSEFASVALQEAQLASRIRHRNVVSILDVGEDPLGLFLVMDYVEGDTLSGLFRRAQALKEPLPTPIGVRILLDALAGLHAAHELRDGAGQSLRVVHRDFSPQNLLVGLDGVTQLTDFGIAKAADRIGYTSTGIVKGKASYMAPEQARGQPLDRRADVWSAGVVAWELFAMQRLYPAGDGLATILQVVQGTPPRLRTVAADAPREVEEVIAEALRPDVEKRIPTAAVLAKRLAQAYESKGPIAATEEVAEYVSAVAGVKLRARRAQLRDALKLHAEMAALAEASVAMTQTPSSRPRREAEPVADPGSDEATTLDRRTATEGTRLFPIAAPSRDLEVAPPPEMHTALTDTTSASDSLAVAGPRRVLRWTAAGAILVVGFVTLGLARGHREQGTGALLPSSATPSEATSGMSVVPASSPAPLASSPSPAPPTTGSAGATGVDPVWVHANTAMLSLTINGRPITVAHPARDLLLERLDAERSAAAKVVAFAADGQKATGSLGPETASIELVFPPRVTPASPNRGRLMLAPSPYSR